MHIRLTESLQNVHDDQVSDKFYIGRKFCDLIQSDLAFCGVKTC